MIHKEVDVAIIGAGISGLSARKILHERGLSTLTLEKARGSGGRMSTKRGEGWIADIGAQFTAASDPRWQNLVESLKSDLLELKIQQDDRYPRFAHRHGMSAFCRALRANTGPENDIHYQTKIMKLTPIVEKRCWALESENSETYYSRSILITAPVPQALELLSNSHLNLSQKSIGETSRLQYSPCLAAVLELDKALPASIPTLWKNPSPNLAGIFDQGRKGLTMSKSVIVIHASAKFSTELWGKENSAILETLLEEFKATLFKSSIEYKILNSVLHRWKYCEPTTIHPEPFLALQWKESETNYPLLLLAGDAFGRSSVEGAFLSGASAAAFIAKSQS